MLCFSLIAAFVKVRAILILQPQAEFGCWKATMVRSAQGSKSEVVYGAHDDCGCAIALK